MISAGRLSDSLIDLTAFIPTHWLCSLGLALSESTGAISAPNSPTKPSVFTNSCFFFQLSQNNPFVDKHSQSCNIRMDLMAVYTGLS